MIRIGILETDELYPDLLSDYRSYGHMFRQFLTALPHPLASQLEFRSYQVTQMEFPQQPNECDAWLVTGSKTGVYDNDPWLEPLANWVKQCFAAGVPQIGVCFGHQFLAHHLGGHAALSDKGWGIGVRGSAITASPSWSTIKASHLRLIYSHRDQVLSLPPEAQRLSGCDFCPNAAFSIDRRVLAFQGHPEFTATYLRRLLPRRREAIGEERFNAGMETLNTSTDDTLAGVWMLDFLRQDGS
ncbi:glutamine amidotransferase-related protein [Oceanobacter kriegii]|uniref:glutamine amidotransferase-related protein n=1 Tax=Oceanobacter kriegii TaxID=64972 RepID=UPI0003F5ED86|nr:hypothetical protein [Oceanobacter kriegii]